MAKKKETNKDLLSDLQKALGKKSGDKFEEQGNNRLSKGMNTDVDPKDQPDGTYRFALNSIHENKEGDGTYYLINEKSNELLDSLPEGNIPIGEEYIGDNVVCILSVREDGTNSEIGLWYKNSTYMTVVNDDCLNFNVGWRVDITYRLKRGCEKVIYFTDNYNSPRYFNFNKIEDFQDEDGNWDCDLFELFLPYSIPLFQDLEIINKGSLLAGSYNFAIQYVDADDNGTPWIYASQLISVYHDSLTNPWIDIQGSSNADSDSGAGKSFPTKKAIKLNITNLDKKFQFYRLARIEATSFNGEVTRVLSSPRIPIEQEEYIVDGLDIGWFQIPVEDIIIKPDKIQKAEHITQLENRLILSNTTGNDVNFCNFQKYASKIASRYTVRKAKLDELETGNSKDPNTYFESMSFMGDEVYAMGIVYVFKDGTESPAFHIPGRSKDSLWDFEEEGCVDCNQDPTSTQSCILINEKPILVSCEDFTLWTLSYQVDGLPRLITRTIPTPADIVGDWGYRVCEDGVITNVILTVFNNGCTARVSEQEGIGWVLEENFPVGTCNLIETKVTECKKCIYVTVDQPDVTDISCSSGSIAYVYYQEEGTNKLVISEEFTVGSGITTKEVICFNQSEDVVITNVVLENLDPNACDDGILVSAVLELQDPNCTTQVETIITPYEDIADSTIIQNWSSNIEHIIPFQDSIEYDAGLINKLERWQVYNTAIPIDDTKGNMAFWQADPQYSYLDVLDCQGNSYWGEDFCGNPLAGEPIRHHKFPSRNKVNHMISSNFIPVFKNQLSIIVTLIDSNNYPSLDPTPLDVEYFIDGNVQNTEVQVSAIDFTSDNDFTKTVIVIRSSGFIDPNNVEITSVVPDINTFFTFDWRIDSINVTPISTFKREVQQLGIEFSNIEYPHPDVVGHYFVRGDRDKLNRTVLTKGISGLMRSEEGDGDPNESPNYNVFAYFWSVLNRSGKLLVSDFKQHYLITPELMYFNEPVDGTYVKFENRFLYSSTDLIGIDNDNDRISYPPERGYAIFKGQKILIEGRADTYSGTASVFPESNHVIEKGLVLNPNHYDDNYKEDYRTYNLSLTNRVQAITLGSQLPWIDERDYEEGRKSYRDINYVSVKVDRNIHTDLFNMTYYRMHNGARDLDTSQIVYGGDIFISQHDIANTLYFEFFQNTIKFIIIGVGIAALATISILAAPSTAPGIASLIGELAKGLAPNFLSNAIVVASASAGAIGLTAKIAQGLVEAYKKNDLEKIASDKEIDGIQLRFTNFISYGNEILEFITLESEYNLSLRQGVEAAASLRFYKTNDDNDFYFRDKIMYFDEGTDKQDKQWKPMPLPTPEIYYYNLDYSRINRESVYFPLLATYDCCSDCLEQHPKRVAWSQQSFQEEKADNYRAFLINDYIDIEGEFGSITGLATQNRRLYVFTEESIFYLPQNLQQQVNGELVTYIGTGEFFGIGTQILVDSDQGTGGTLHKWSIIKTPMGIFYGSVQDNRICVITKTIDDISRNGMRFFFRENYKTFLKDQIEEVTGLQFDGVNSPSSPSGTGMIATYDNIHNRYIVTLKEYAILENRINDLQFVETDNQGNIISGTGTDLVYDTKFRRFAVITDPTTCRYITLQDTDYFYNRSFTMSYGLGIQGWVSFHSYLPMFYFYTPKYFYSMIDKNIWRHQMENNYQTFYGVFQRHIIEYVIVGNALKARVWNNLFFITKASKYNESLDSYYEERYITHDTITVYNSRQCTGVLTMIVKDTQNNPEDYINQQVTNNPGEVIIDRNELNWTINELFDYRVDYNVPIFDENVQQLQNAYFIDKVINVFSIDQNKDWFDTEKFRDKYLIVRLEFSTLDDIELITQYLLDQSVNSYR